MYCLDVYMYACDVVLFFIVVDVDVLLLLLVDRIGSGRGDVGRGVEGQRLHHTHAG